jgi:hypothetical protein
VLLDKRLRPSSNRLYFREFDTLYVTGCTTLSPLYSHACQLTGGDASDNGKARATSDEEMWEWDVTRLRHSGSEVGLFVRVVFARRWLSNAVMCERSELTSNHLRGCKTAGVQLEHLSSV